MHIVVHHFRFPLTPSVGVFVCAHHRNDCHVVDNFREREWVPYYKRYHFHLHPSGKMSTLSDACILYHVEMLNAVAKHPIPVEWAIFGPMKIPYNLKSCSNHNQLKLIGIRDWPGSTLLLLLSMQLTLFCLYSYACKRILVVTVLYAQYMPNDFHNFFLFKICICLIESLQSLFGQFRLIIRVNRKSIWKELDYISLPSAIYFSPQKN